MGVRLGRSLFGENAGIYNGGCLVSWGDVDWKELLIAFGGAVVLLSFSEMKEEDYSRRDCCLAVSDGLN